jgi:hypothetical protein
MSFAKLFFALTSTTATTTTAGGGFCNEELAKRMGGTGLWQQLQKQS